MSADEVKGVLSQKAGVRPVLSFQNITFRLGSAELEDRALAQLREIAKALAETITEGKVPARVRLTGHCDRHPFKNAVIEDVSAGRDRALSRRRAEAVTRWLSDALRGKLAADVFEAMGKGFDEPIDPRPMDDADHRNRRVERQISLTGE